MGGFPDSKPHIYKIIENSWELMKMEYSTVNPLPQQICSYCTRTNTRSAVVEPDP
jgi:hypothetical protein